MDNELDRRLAPLRARIDEIDAALIDLLNQRARVALEVGEVKKHFDAPVFRPERERQVIERLQRLGQGPLANEHVEAIWRQIMSASRAIEAPQAVAYLGPEGTFSEQAALAYFGDATDRVAAPSIDEVFRAVESGAVDFAVVPVENSTEGVVSRTLDLLLRTTRPITGEVSLPIHHHLLCRDAGAELASVARVCAHPQALAQCQHWLSQHLPNAERVPVSSNAEGARRAAIEAGTAAIAGERALQRYQLHAAARMIQDDPHNRTRFYVLGGTPPLSTGRDQTSLILSVRHEAGAVHRMLAPLARHGVSMNRFESRPARSGEWEYYFYVDVAGHANDQEVAAALADLRRDVLFFKLLGSYPRAQ
ncbi:prephenate dehydratase [Chitinasiproducens palmae]|uniref:Bifunctional chorismate mutase/prephenate dehydratase n=1 Tax=Chitinasiproducens palmae TaxID=1770053 RepID=A0A1H2PV02_9BURK|nr:prephenate dehydratase [Chitinasiproducens palmae]SDV51097.1 chorismate mutase [Chitinasiproducens palmae]